MSETVIPVRDPVAEDRARVRNENLKIAREKKLRAIAERKAEPRTAADVKSPPPATAERAAPAREDLSRVPEEQLTRRRRHERDTGSLEVPAHRKKPGWDYQYITIRVLGEPVDGARIRDYREGGWRPVLAKDMPELVEPNTSPDSPVESEGQRLYTRPMNLTNEAKQEDLDYAMQQQRDRTLAAASGQSAVRGEEGIPNRRGIVRRPVDIQIEGLAGS